MCKCGTEGKRNKKYCNGSWMSLRTTWLQRCHQRTLQRRKKSMFTFIYKYRYVKAGYKIWLELKLTANCDVIQTVPWILSLACAAEPFLNEVLAVILKTFVLKPVINVCSFILTVITKEMWLLSKLVPDCFSFIPCVVLGISFLTTFSNWRSTAKHHFGLWVLKMKQML